MRLFPKPQSLTFFFFKFKKYGFLHEDKFDKPFNNLRLRIGSIMLPSDSVDPNPVQSLVPNNSSSLIWRIYCEEKASQLKAI